MASSVAVYKCHYDTTRTVVVTMPGGQTYRRIDLSDLAGDGVLFRRVRDRFETFRFRGRISRFSRRRSSVRGTRVKYNIMILYSVDDATEWTTTTGGVFCGGMHLESWVALSSRRHPIYLYNPSLWWAHPIASDVLQSRFIACHGR